MIQNCPSLSDRQQTISEMLTQLTTASSASDVNNYSALFNRFDLLPLLMPYTVLSVSVIQIEKASIVLSAASVSLLKASIKLIQTPIKSSVALKKLAKPFI